MLQPRTKTDISFEASRDESKAGFLAAAFDHPQVYVSALGVTERAWRCPLSAASLSSCEWLTGNKAVMMNNWWYRHPRVTVELPLQQVDDVTGAQQLLHFLLCCKNCSFQHHPLSSLEYTIRRTIAAR